MTKPNYRLVHQNTLFLKSHEAPTRFLDNDEIDIISLSFFRSRDKGAKYIILTS